MSDSVGQYLSEIGAVSLLSADEERELSKVIEAGQRALRCIQAGDCSAENRAAVRRRCILRIWPSSGEVSRTSSGGSFAR